MPILMQDEVSHASHSPWGQGRRAYLEIRRQGIFKSGVSVCMRWWVLTKPVIISVCMHLYVPQVVMPRTLKLHSQHN